MMLRKTSNLITCLFFLLAISLPLVGCLLKWQTTSSDLIRIIERRESPAIPGTAVFNRSTEKYFQQFEASYSDNFGFRKPLIFLNAYIKVFLFHTSSSREVLLGKNHWLFFANKPSQTYYRHTSLFDAADLISWRTMLERRRDWLAAQGMHFIFVIAPNKETIYPEWVPSRINQVQDASRLDQLVQYMKQNSNVEIVDLRDALRAEKSVRELYLSGDTHWNQYGAFIGYQEIMKRVTAIYPQIKPLKLSDYSIHNIPHQPDLAGMLGLQEQFTAPMPIFALRNGQMALVAEPGISPPGMPPSSQSFVLTMQDPSLPTAVVFRDSFSVALAPLLGQHFRRAVFLWQDDFDASIILKEKPNLVIQELVERQLMKPPSMLSRDVVNGYPVPDLSKVAFGKP